MATDTLSLDFGRDKPFYVYLYRDPRPRKKNAPIYVGKGTAAHERADSHWRYGTHNLILGRILQKIRNAGLEPAIEIVAWFDHEADAFALETALIRQIGRRDLRSGPLANMADGGGGVRGRVWTDEDRERWGVMLKRRWAAPEYAAAISEMMLQQWADPEKRAMRSARSAEAQRRPEVRKRRSEISRKYWDNATPEQLAAQIAALHSPAAREKAAKSIRRHHQSDEYRQSKQAETAAKWADPAHREMRVARMAEAHQRPEEKRRKREASLLAWDQRKTAMDEANRAAWADPIRRAARLESIRAARIAKKRDAEMEK